MAALTSHMPGSASGIRSLPSLPLDQQREILKAIEGLDDEEASLLEYDWEFWARANQLPPVGDWSYWMILAGRGFGKTRTGAEWVRAQIGAGKKRLALVGPTAADVRDVMVEGESGILAISPPWERPIFQPSKRRLVWPSGAMAFLYSAEEPERLRGPQHDAAWADELAAWKYAQETWDQLQFGLRLGDCPQACITTTPRPIPLVRALVAEPDCKISRGSTYDNKANLAPTFVSKIIKRYEGTKLGRQELHAELLDDVPGALWPYEVILRARVREHPDLQRVVVAIDPSGSNGEDEGDQQGIVVAGLGVDGRGYVLADRTCKLSPSGWGQRGVAAFDEFRADRIVAEKNYGGDMVRFVIQTARKTAPVTLVNASRGKVVRAEPVAALYEQGRVSHVIADNDQDGRVIDNPLAELEEEMRLTGSTGYMGDGSPNRMDALVWALTELLLGDDAPVATSSSFAWG